MRIVFRVDGSRLIGSGHVMRCLALADALKAAGSQASFLCRDAEGHLAGLIRKCGFDVELLPPKAGSGIPASGPAHRHWLGTDWGTDAEECSAALARAGGKVDWLVVDHYALDERWESRMRKWTRNLMAIDDLADRPHDCDVIFDQNLYRSFESRYDGLVGAGTRKLLGPRFALLRREFREKRASLKPRQGPARKLLAFFGGVDATDETGKILDAWESLGPAAPQMDVVLGSGNARREALRERCSRHTRLTCRVQIEDMAEAMSQADLSLGAGGTSTWERCCMALPTLCISVAENQRASAAYAGEAGIHYYLGHYNEVGDGDVAAALEKWVFDTAGLAAMARQAGDYVDGEGTTRVADALRFG
jgi:UDP-2,4-diacetamido-2,4,6-trideoxy-beta-L-altropyranose hydrolase